MITLSVNGETYTLDIEHDIPLLWALRCIRIHPGCRYRSSGSVRSVLFIQPEADR